jgi:type VI secretion system secreted protein VgrG
MQANAVSISSWDPEQLVAPSAEQQSHLAAGDLPEMAIYDGTGERIASDGADFHSELMLKALELQNKTFEGAGAVRRLAAGHAFDLTQHEQFAGGEARFKVLWVEHEARNNFASQIKGAAGTVEAGTYRNTFGCVRETVAIVPTRAAAPHASTALGPQTALIVGLPDAISTTNRDHRVKVQFAWQRGAAPNAGGATHNTAWRKRWPGQTGALNSARASVPRC